MNNGEPDCYFLGNDVDDGNMEGNTTTIRVDVDPLLLQELRSLFGDDWTDQTLCRHAIATLIGYPSYASCSRMEHPTP